ncbi:hypothetical protein [Marivita hallyeonensis]|uniref:Uncharacterized protein n=1 Tax=Marivita hallyeonensis TaxID=996342 RepID=A0A1M5TS79_9RHOB|nr:hypothetical protein [Marivita hallyeonensis]SHH53549.1 hypothetical protein SAMN05443551_2340 [Marivita hallyeonensis]
MLVFVLFCGFFLGAMVLGLNLTHPRQAWVSGIATCTAAAVAAFTLWITSKAGFTEAWLAIAMIGVIVLPALMIGLGLLAGALVRTARNRKLAIGAALLPPSLLLLVPFLP